MGQQNKNNLLTYVKAWMFLKLPVNAGFFIIFAKQSKHTFIFKGWIQNIVLWTYLISGVCSSGRFRDARLLQPWLRFLVVVQSVGCAEILLLSSLNQRRHPPSILPRSGFGSGFFDACACFLAHGKAPFRVCYQIKHTIPGAKTQERGRILQEYSQHTWNIE